MHLLSPVKLIGLVNREEEREAVRSDGQIQSRLAHAWINSVRYQIKRCFPFKRAEFADATLLALEGGEKSASKQAFPHHMAEGRRVLSPSLIKQYEPSNDERERVCNEVVSGLGST